MTMAEYERSRTMPAQPEHVFDQAANVDQLDAWLPDALHVDVEDPPAVTVHEDRTGEDMPALLRSGAGPDAAGVGDPGAGQWRGLAPGGGHRQRSQRGRPTCPSSTPATTRASRR